MKRRIFAVAFFALSILTAFAQEVIRNQDVIALVKAGLSETVVIEKIKNSKTDFDLSTNALIELKKNGVTDKIVAAMFASKSGSESQTFTINSESNQARKEDPNDPLTPRDYGIYLYEEKNGTKRMTQLLPVIAKARVGGGLTAAIVPFGLGKVKHKAAIPGKTAKVVVDTPNPVFYFYLYSQSGGFHTAGVPAYPTEFTLVKFHIRSDKREVSTGEANAYGAKVGVSGEYVVEFDYESLGKGIFKVTPKKPLENGEYAFYLPDTGVGAGARFFDFSVQVTP
ncbi:MAG: hypothetical protein N2Z23_08560 [Pyrinomonadaceae bacterium]|nr:hypothetical protein [Pyrinomonadaceae bacterium]MCX7640473.1 hypothetical protein [Pyrinomonadaceae bacterium]MDW8305419.1 hypothetical protein [Acidobacteriota bacterium]